MPTIINVLAQSLIHSVGLTMMYCSTFVNYKNNMKGGLSCHRIKF